MAPYYYIVGSLPHLFFPGKPPFLFPEFVEQCAPWLRARDFRQLELAGTDIGMIPLETVTNGLLKSWISFENTIRNELVVLRAADLGLSADSYMKTDLGLDVEAISLTHQALQEPDPYLVEMKLLKIRWDFLVNHEVGHYFDLTALINYGLKLQLLERLNSFDEEKGRQILNLVYERNLGWTAET